MDTRLNYLKELAEEFNISLETVMSFSEMLGPSEDFDGLVTLLEDYSQERYSSNKALLLIDR